MPGPIVLVWQVIIIVAIALPKCFGTMVRAISYESGKFLRIWFKIRLLSNYKTDASSLGAFAFGEFTFEKII